MRKKDIPKEQYDRILSCFMENLMKSGFKGTTMDSIATSLQMSKRTLYEIFGNKEELFRQAHTYFHKRMSEKLTQIFASSHNVMEAIIRCFLYNRDFMSKLSSEFIKDMSSFSNKKDQKTEIEHRSHHQNLYDVLLRGVQEGYFRNDVNLKVQSLMLTLQMKSLKSSEDLFPENISLLEIYDNIMIGFLRGISSKKGLDEIDKYMPHLSSLQ